MTASQAARLIATGAISSVALLDALLDRIQKTEPEVHAWAFLNPDQVREQAKIRDSMKPIGPLHGVPVGIKDVIATADQPTTYNSSIYAGHQPLQDAICIKRLREAGAIIMGKTVTAEFAFRHPGPTRNPHDISRTPGGSSSGSAAAVAARMIPAALATQTGGSTIRPSTYCGIFGYKPALGTYDTAGLKYLAPSLDTITVMARDIDDLALISGVLADAPPAPLAPSEEPPTFALFYTPYLDQAAASTRRCLDNVGERASAAGARVRILEGPEWMSALDRAHSVIMAREAAGSLAPEWQNRRSELSIEISELIERGLSYSLHDVADARATIAFARRWFVRHVELNELILTFATSGEAPRGGSDLGSAIFNRLWSALDGACLSVPVTRGAESMPIGIQLIETSGDETCLLRAGRWLVRALSQRNATNNYNQ